MVVRMRHTRAHTGNRRSHHSIKSGEKSVCPKCKSAILSHTACAVCGTYKGREVIDVLKKTKKIEAKHKRREEESKQG